MANNNQEEIYSTNGEVIDAPIKKEKNSKTQEIERWLNSAYVFRLNWIKQKPEYREKISKDLKFHPIDKYKLLSIKRQLDAAGFTISKDGLMDIIFSDFSPKVNPVKDYFENLFPWDEETDYIEELCNTVRCKNTEQWTSYLKKWLVGVVANVFIEERCANHTMLVLTGSQGKFKTTWLENLCPKTLTNYLYTGKLNLESKDSLTLIAENLFINIDDQLKQLHKKDENELKNLITINYVKYRRPYDPIITEYPHLCSFMGSVNGNEFLNDPTGSRRFLPFEVENINIKESQNLDIDLVWAQAYHLFINKFRYWFIDDEIDELNKRNNEFSMISQEEELLNYYYSNKLPEFSNAVFKCIPPAILLAELQQKTKQNLSPKKLGEALTKLGYVKRQMGSAKTSSWQVYQKSEFEINQQQTE
ncbi:MAG: virulence protein [Bacteroidetes bacterium]|jgi:predicted P-loop ATPase|nr:virulence protein [Bacteroidota bacterium]